jgi:geranylgeranyl diphosphate synthase type II
MNKIVQLSQLIESELNTIQFPSSPENLYDPLTYFLSIGGKRLRPVLTLLSAELGGTDKEEAISCALAIEIFHNFSLIHDDIMDDAPLRRGKVTVHEKWNSNIAILSGDVLLVKAYQLLSKQKAQHIPELLSLFNQTAIEVCEGQQMDMDFETREFVSVEEYIEMIRLKTSVLLGCALEFGFIVSENSLSNRKKIYEFGVNLGIAFQIQDDILDLYGDPEKVGKQVGGDVKSNKKTLLYLIAEKNATGELRAKLNEIKSELDLNLKIPAIQEIYEVLGVKKETKNYLDIYYQRAIDLLESIETDNDKTSIIEMIDVLFNREH